MSAFKRYQSKVFWDQMASRDLAEEDRFSERSDPPRDRSHEKNEEEEEEEEEENSTSKSENDTVDGGNITAIRVYKSPNEDPRQNACWISTRDESVARHRTEMEETGKDEERRIVMKDRSCSPLSQDLKSLDSGFSDSERSDCSEAYENATPRWKLRRRRRRTGQRRIRTEIASSPSWLEEGPPSNPMHTSTPKDSTRVLQAARNRLARSLARDSSRGQRIDEERRNDASEVSSRSLVSLEDECLGDFLYASEPPEDNVVQPAKSPTSTVDDSASEAISAGREVLNSRNYRQSSSMRAWLTDLATETENECGNALQSKNLPRRTAPAEWSSGETRARDLKTLSSAATAAASKLLVSAEQFERHYRDIVEKITHLKGGRSEMELLRSIEEAAFSLLSHLGAPPPRRIQQGSLRSVLAQLQNMKVYVDGTIDTRLDFYIEKIIRGLEEAPREDGDVARGALAALTALGLSDPRAGCSIARCSGIKALLTCLLGRPASDDLVAVALRALASVCCSAMVIEHFARDGGPEILTDLLAAESTTEKEMTEATALVVQITAPWTNAAGLPYLEPYASVLIPALNQLVESTGCAQTLLLAAAALNYVSRSRPCADIVLAEDSVRKLLRSVKKSAAGGNVWLMEQVAALIGELARLPEGRTHLARARASVALVSFLRMRPPGLEDAYRRLEMTATAALTRLCVEPEIARQVVAVGGGDCLPAACDVDEVRTSTAENDEVQVEAGLLRYTRSLRRACKKAARQIGIAKAKDRSALD